MEKKNRKIVLVTNHLTPYRRKFYDDFYNACRLVNIEFKVLLMTKLEPNRNWDYDSLRVEYGHLMNGFHFLFPINNHFNPSVINDLNKFKPDLILLAGSYMYYTNWLVLINKWRLNVPVVYWSEAHFNEKRNYNKLTLAIREFCRKLIFSRFDGYCYSGLLSKRFVTFYANQSSKFYFLPNFIDNDVYQEASSKNENEIEVIKNRLNIPIDNVVIIVPARLSEEKGIHLAIDLLVKVKSKKKFTVLIPGTGPYEKNIRYKISTTDLDVRLLGFQSQKVMIELYSISTFFMLPSLSDPNPLTCIEALWSGLPLIVSEHVGNYPEVVSDGVNGFVFNYSNTEEAVNKINLMISSDADWLEKAKRKSLEIANTLYKSETIIEKMIQEMVNDFMNNKEN